MAYVSSAIAVFIIVLGNASGGSMENAVEMDNLIDGQLARSTQVEVHHGTTKKAAYSKLCVERYGALFDHICADGLNCLPAYCVCDGFPNCWDKSDEVGCENRAIKEKKRTRAFTGGKVLRLEPYHDHDGCAVFYPHAPLRCADEEPLCMKKSQICDGFQQCADNSDEQTCGYGIKDNTVCTKPHQKQINDTASLKLQLFEAHNYYRCLHGVPLLKWDKTLEKYGDHLAASNAIQGRLEHSYFGRFGENIAMQEVKGIDRITGLGFVKMFHDEIKLFNFKNPKFSFDTGHFTQLIWKTTKRIGCGSSLRHKKHWTQFYVACEYDPPGNIDEDAIMTANVLPLL
ncbi:uncharacterized protein LOC144440485 [Glandiceps talaboti]